MPPHRRSRARRLRRDPLLLIFVRRAQGSLPRARHRLEGPSKPVESPPRSGLPQLERGARPRLPSRHDPAARPHVPRGPPISDARGPAARPPPRAQTRTSHGISRASPSCVRHFRDMRAIPLASRGTPGIMPAWRPPHPSPIRPSPSRSSPTRSPQSRRPQPARSSLPHCPFLPLAHAPPPFQGLRGKRKGSTCTQGDARACGIRLPWAPRGAARWP